MFKRVLVLTIALVALLATPAAAQYTTDSQPPDTVLPSETERPDPLADNGGNPNGAASNDDVGNSSVGSSGVGNSASSSNGDTGSGALARTGADNLLSLVGLGMALLVVGSAVLLTLNKRRTAEVVA